MKEAKDTLRNQRTKQVRRLEAQPAEVIVVRVQPGAVPGQRRRAAILILKPLSKCLELSLDKRPLVHPNNDAIELSFVLCCPEETLERREVEPRIAPVQDFRLLIVPLAKEAPIGDYFVECERHPKLDSVERASQPR